MKTYFLGLALLLFATASAQKRKPSEIVRITYLKTSNGNLVDSQDPIVVFATPSGSFITSEKILAEKADIPFENTEVDITRNLITQTGHIGQLKSVETIDSLSLTKQSLELTPDTKKILGYTCKKAKTVINSNWIDIWYTTELSVYGGPSPLGQKLGLVLETVRNGNFAVTASRIEKKARLPLANSKTALRVDALTYKDVLWKSRFTKIELFNKQPVNFTDDTIADANTVRLNRGQVVLRRIAIPKIPKDSQVFLDVTEKSKGDAYDRTGLVFIVPTDNPSQFIASLKAGGKPEILSRRADASVHTKNTPQLELMRFFTPFGVSQYNYIRLKGKTWQDSVMYRQDISDLADAISEKEVIVGINIGNYDKGGHEVTANLTVHHENGAKPRPESVILPLFNTSDALENAPDVNAMLKSENGYASSFSIARPLKNVRLRYTSTGHGGWENGDEFQQRKNTILVDGKEVYSFVPWRTDCGSYRLSNPASGNFENGLSSSDYSRSNWCPGTTTNPIWIELGDLGAGEHTVSVKIPVGDPEGQSTSSWILSGVLIGEP